MGIKFNIGADASSGADLFLRPDDMKLHALFVGGTRRGKSKYLEHTSRFFLRNKIPQLVLDPAGETVRDIMAYAASEYYGSRIIYIDLNEAVNHAVFPLNFLRRTSIDVATHASRIMKAIAKVFKEEGSDTKPRLERRERATLMALIEAEYTMAEMLHFLSISDNTFRNTVLARVRNPFVLSEWAEYDSLQRRADKETMLESCLNRAAKIILNEPVRRCLGAQECGLDWDKITREGKTVLVNLQPRLVSRECMELVGILILDHLVNHATQLEKPFRKPLYVLCDELDELASPDLAYSMQALTKRNVYIWGFIQYLEQLRSKGETAKLYHSAMANCDLKVAFHTSYEDAKLLVREMFAGCFTGDIVKDEIHRTMLIPKETVRKVLTQTEVRSQSETVSDSEGESTSHMSVDSISSGMAESSAFTIDNGFLYDHSVHGSSQFGGSSGGSAYGDSSSRQKSRGKSSGSASGKAEAVVPFYEYLEREELSSRTYYTIEELVEKYIAFIQCQPQRHAHAKLRDNKAVSIITPYVDSPRVRTRDIDKIVERSNKRFTISPEEADQFTAERLQIASDSKPEDEIEDDRDRWQ